MGNVQGVGFAGPWIPVSAFAGTGTITRPRLFKAYKNESYLTLGGSALTGSYYRRHCSASQRSMSQVLPFDIIALIIATGDISGDNKDTSLFGLQGTCSGLFSLLIPTSSSASNTVGFFKTLIQ